MTDITTKPVSTARLKQIAHAIADGNYRELTMRIPADPDRDADLVISAAADEIDRLRAEVAGLRAALDRLLCATEGHDVCPYAKAEARYVLTPEGK